MNTVKTPEEITSMRVGGKKLGVILKELLSMSTIGVNLLDVEKHAVKRIKEEGGVPSFTTVEGYPFVTCLCINEEVVHGMPRNYVLRDGDIVTIDIGMIYEGLHTDTASSICIGMIDDEKELFLKTGEIALGKAIEVAIAGKRVGDISKAIQTTIESAGYHVVTDLTGHGVGRILHEEPMIPEYVRGDIAKTPLLASGMTLAIEVIYAMGQGSICYKSDDGWTLESKDRSLTATFEHTIAIGDIKSEVLTKREI
ncbi:MAG: methionine aminopeptidase, methionyl aminopeptidase [Microgenomates group bacterium GW2011_GWC1_39_12]|nr:MAG: methionine aminopeptidase, methionyl aminopeptidase [Microgenomates group bacterium GW2011_GWC1_39_12]